MKEIDIEGESTLNAISKANNFNFWMYRQMEPYIRGNVLEIGSGIGNISKYIKTDGKIVLSDLREQYIDKLRHQYPERQIINLDLVHPHFTKEYSNIIGQFDFVFALNVVEHIEDDQLALYNMGLLLKKGGTMFVLVPAYQILFNEFDRALEHYRRYTKATLNNVLPNSVELKRSWYFNALGIAGWIIVGKILGKKIIPESNMSVYNKIVPLAKVIDFLLARKIGLSVISISQKL